MKVSEVTLEYVLKYLRIDMPDDYDKEIIVGIFPSALSFIKSYTGLDETAIDEHEDITIAYLVLIEDMYDNRTMNVSATNVNRTVKTILGMHSVNNVG